MRKFRLYIVRDVFGRSPVQIRRTTAQTRVFIPTVSALFPTDKLQHCDPEKHLACVLQRNENT